MPYTRDEKMNELIEGLIKTREDTIKAKDAEIRALNLTLEVKNKALDRQVVESARDSERIHAQRDEIERLKVKISILESKSDKVTQAYCDELQMQKAEIERLRADISELQTALGIYANPNNYDEQKDNKGSFFEVSGWLENNHEKPWLPALKALNKNKPIPKCGRCGKESWLRPCFGCFPIPNVTPEEER